MSVELPEGTWPVLIGLAGGWVLGGFNYALRVRSDKRQRLTRALSVVLIVNAAGRSHKAVTDKFKDGAEDWEEFEKYRQRSLERLGAEIDRIEPYIQSTIEVALDYFPHMVQDFQIAIESARTASKRTLSASTSNADLYIHGLSTLEVVAHGQRILEERIMRALSWKIGPFTWLRTRRLIYKAQHPSENTESNSAFLSDLAAKMMSKVRSHNNGE